MQNNELLPLGFRIHKKVDSQWIIDLNVRAKIIKFLEEIIWENFCSLGKGNDNFDRTQTAQTTEDKTDILDLTKSKLLLDKELFYGNLKASHQLGENICNIKFEKGHSFSQNCICRNL